jgi:hypothetical protein
MLRLSMCYTKVSYSIVALYSEISLKRTLSNVKVLLGSLLLLVFFIKVKSYFITTILSLLSSGSDGI